MGKPKHTTDWVKIRAGIILMVLLFLQSTAYEVVAPQVVVADNLVVNSGFEDGTHFGNWFYHTCWDGEWWEYYPPIEVPLEWEFYFAMGCVCDDYGTMTGRPEAGLVGLVPDPLRVHSGLQAFRAFTFFRCHSFWLKQTVPLTPTDGVQAYWIDAQAYVHAWFSDCSTRPHDPPYWPGCDSPAPWAHDWTQLCVAPQGVYDPRDPRAICSESVEVYGVYDGPVQLSTRVPFTGSLELILWSSNSAPLKHADWYLDDVSLTVQMAERGRLYLPLVAR